MFNNCDSNSNGEFLFYNNIKSKINIIFDVGCRTDSLFVDFIGEVHYFDPVPEFIKQISTIQNKNKLSYYNNFGLGNENVDKFYYPKYQSFYNRTISCNVNDESNKITLNIKKAKDYILQQNIKSIDFVKIDTEGYELNVLMGFEELLNSVKIIQFEYGGTYLDSGTKLIDIVSYLRTYGFCNFSYLTSSGTELINDFSDHYNYCNIICINNKCGFSIT